MAAHCRLVYGCFTVSGTARTRSLAGDSCVRWKGYRISFTSIAKYAM